MNSNHYKGIQASIVIIFVISYSYFLQRYYINQHNLPSVSDESSYVFTAPDISQQNTLPMNAYAIMHYEGTQRDDEYVLAVRVLIESLKQSGTKYDIVIMASHNVRETTLRQFAADGCKIIRLDNIDNPYKRSKERRRTWKDHFEFTLNKLYLWKMIRYRRIVFLDADNIIMHNVDMLFQCGHFCAEYMNQVFFHTGLLVVKPDIKRFEDMLRALNELPSYDGADQGFLTAFFGAEAMQLAPMFRPPAHGVVSELPLERLPYWYNLNHVYYYQRMQFVHHRLYHEVANLTGHYFPVPAYTVAYPITPLAKPWVWWSYFFFDMHWEWKYFREFVNELNDWNSFALSRLSFAIILYGCGEWFLDRVINSKLPSPLALMRHHLTRFTCYSITVWPAHGVNVLSVILLAINHLLIGVMWLVAYSSLLPVITPPSFAFLIFFTYHNLLAYWFISFFAIFTRNPRPSVSLVMLPLFLWQCFAMFCLTRTGLYGGFLIKIWFFVFYLVIMFLYEMSFLRNMAYAVLIRAGHSKMPIVGAIRVESDHSSSSSANL